MYDPESVPTNLTEDEQLKINDETYRVVSTSDRQYSHASKGVVTVRLHKRGERAPWYKNDTTHLLRAVYELDRYTEPFDDEESTVIKEKLSAGRGSFSSPDWGDEVTVESIECVTREATRPLTEVEEGDEIRFNGRKRPLVVQEAYTTDVTSEYGDTKKGEVTIVKAEGAWDGAASYKLRRYSDDMKAYTRDKKHKGDQARVERLQKNSRGARKYLKDDDLTTVAIVEEAEKNEVMEAKA